MSREAGTYLKYLVRTMNVKEMQWTETKREAVPREAKLPHGTIWWVAKS